ncbi:MAG: DeoR/GlpR family DNA-binding transcription regulator [Fusobacteriaceae bacterium]
MLNIEREKHIMGKLKEKQSIKLKEIVETLNISEATVRRDLNNLEIKGKIKRIHGGAVLIEKYEGDIVSKEKINIEGKELIGKKAIEYIREGDVIYLDAGTTVGKMIKYLKEKKVKVLTNGISHIPKLIKYGIETYLIGGKIKEKTSAIVGFSAVESLKKYSIDKAFIGANTVSKKGYGTPDSEEAIVKQCAIENSREIFFLCDSSKFTEESFIIFASLESGKLISDKK